jgi:nascent polypeptide-associated complex subunit beta
MAIYGHGQDKDLTELVPGILNQLGPDSLASLRKLAESYQNLTARQAAEKKESGEGEDEGDDVPDLVENFEEVDEADAKKDEAKLEELA